MYLEDILMRNFNVAIPTPFHEDESLYLEGFDAIVEHLKTAVSIRYSYAARLVNSIHSA